MNTKFPNLNQVKELLNIYRNITVEDIKKYDKEYENKYPEKYDNNDCKYFKYYGEYILNKLTGFGFKNSCIICNMNDVTIHCIDCFYKSMTNNKCNSGKNIHTYKKIRIAKDAQSLYYAIRCRIIYIEKLINKFEKENKNV